MADLTELQKKRREERKARRAENAQKFKDQKVTEAKDFNFQENDREKQKEKGTHISGQETRFLAKEFGREEAYNALQAQKEAGATIGGRAEKKMQRMGERIEARKKAQAAQGATNQVENPIDSTQTGTNDGVPDNQGITDENAGNYAGGTPGFYENQPSTPYSNTDITNKQIQKIRQDNDQTSTINGDNNTVYQTQDNSIRQYGGDNRSFVYNGGGSSGNQYEDTPASMATLGGFYDVDDSPAAQAKQFDLFNDLNNQAQKRYAGDALMIGNAYSKFDPRDYTTESMNNALNSSTQNSYDRADVETGLTFGDIWNKDYITEDFKMPDDPEEIKSNVGQIAQDGKDDIEDM